MSLEKTGNDSSLLMMETNRASHLIVDRVHVPNNIGYIKCKRFIDIVGATLGIVVLIPVFIVVSVLIKLQDRSGPVFFKQKRVGENEREFYMYKFRSMVTNAEDLLKELADKNEIQGAMFKIKNDPRITPIGKFIRKTSIDELPQLWNVLKGEMSLVGPRPPLPAEVEQYTTREKQRLLVRPGCTGLWQVSGRNRLSFDQMVELDLNYIRTRSTKQDLKIILKTFSALLGKDAY